MIIALIDALTKHGSSSNSGNSTNTTAAETTAATTAAETTTVATTAATTSADLSNVATEYTLSSGNYVAGIDIPAGTCDVTAASGGGNLYSSNLYDGGINETFGVDDGSGLYTSSFKGLALPEKTVLTVSGTLTIKLEFSKVASNYSGRSYNESSAVQLSSGNYTAGTDFDAGVYKIVAKSGNGNLYSSNLYDGGLNEMFGIDDGTGSYTQEFINVDLPEGTTLTASGGLSIELIPASINS